MDTLRIRGGRRLEGEVAISGAKNAALPELCAALLTPGRVQLHNVPQLRDVATMLKLLRTLGVVATEGDGGRRRSSLVAADGELARGAVRAGQDDARVVLVLGPLVARYGEARVSLPGGCAIGARPIDQHLKGLQAMGAKITLEHGYVVARARAPEGRAITPDMPTVTGTENLLMAAALAKGET